MTRTTVSQTAADLSGVGELRQNCPVEKERRRTLALCRDLTRGLRRLRRSLRACQACPAAGCREEADDDCPFLEKLYADVQEALEEVWEMAEW